MGELVTIRLMPWMATDRRGYTGHEMLAPLAPDLVHMNGRVYEETIGRFTSAEPPHLIKFTPSRMEQIQSHLPNGRAVPVYETR
jgi:hypothetical protein